MLKCCPEDPWVQGSGANWWTFRERPGQEGSSLISGLKALITCWEVIEKMDRVLLEEAGCWSAAWKEQSLTSRVWATLPHHPLCTIITPYHGLTPVGLPECGLNAPDWAQIHLFSFVFTSWGKADQHNIYGFCLILVFNKHNIVDPEARYWLTHIFLF